MKSVLFKTLPLVLALGLVGNANAGDEKICKIEDVIAPVYAGWAKCTTNGVQITDYVSHSYSSSKYLTQFSGGTTYACWATVPFSHNETHQVEVCKYTPAASFHVSQTPRNLIGHNVVTIRSTSTDRDNDINSYKWYVDGSLSGTGSSLRLNTIDQETVNVKLTVTDAEGYTDTYQRNVTLQAWSCDWSCNLH